MLGYCVKNRPERCDDNRIEKALELTRARSILKAKPRALAIGFQGRQLDVSFRGQPCTVVSIFMNLC